MTAASGAIETFTLTRAFGSIVAVRDLSLEVPAGELFGLLGPNGSGKTTTIRMLTTLLPPTSGTARVAGADIATEPAAVRARIGVALQQTGLDPAMTVRQMLRLQASLHGLAGREGRRRGDELIDALRLGEHSTVPVQRLSGGLRRRADLAVALVHRPAVLFLDEPTAGLDPQSRRDLWSLIRSRSASGTTIVLTTQYLEEADQLADRVGILRAGELITCASPDLLKNRVGERSLRIVLADEGSAVAATDLLSGHGDEPSLVPPREVRVRLFGGSGDSTGGVSRRLLALAGAGLEVVSVDVTEPSLEDVYLRLAAA